MLDTQQEPEISAVLLSYWDLGCLLQQQNRAILLVIQVFVTSSDTVC